MERFFLESGFSPVFFSGKNKKHYFSTTILTQYGLILLYTIFLSPFSLLYGHRKLFGGGDLMPFKDRLWCLDLDRTWNSVPQGQHLTH